MYNAIFYQILMLFKFFGNFLQPLLKRQFFNTCKFSCFRRCLPIGIHWWLGKIQWNFTTWKTILLQSPKHSRYYWCRLYFAKRVCKDFEIKNLGEYHDLHVQSNTLLLYFTENFWNVCLEIYEVDPTRFLIVTGLAWQAALKKGQNWIRSFH